MIVPATAIAASDVGFSAPYAGLNDWSEEPNVAVAGSVPYNWDGETSGDYPADANNVGDVIAGQGLVTARVLNAKWAPYAWPMTVVFGTWSGTGFSGAANPDANALMSSFTGKNFIYPATESSITAFLGQWSDLDGDGFRDYEGHWRNGVDGHDRPVYVNLDSRNECQDQGLRTDDPDGFKDVAGGEQGNLVPNLDVPGGTGISKRCTAANEWSGEDGNKIVGYYTPGNWDTIASGVTTPGNLDTLVDVDGIRIDTPCPIPLLTRPDCAPRKSQEQPDITFTPGDFYGPGTYSYEFVFGVTIAGSVLETTVTEIFSDAQLTPDGPRSFEPGPASLVDTDVYQSVDPLLEGLYQTAVHGIVEKEANKDSEQRNATWNAVYGPVADIVGGASCDPDAVESARCFLDPRAGPHQAKFAPPRHLENHMGYDHATEPHLYLDMRLVESAGYSAVALASNGIAAVPGTQYTPGYSRFTPDASGTQTPGSGNANTFVRITLDGRFGAWFDANGDGFIGNPVRTKTCPDAYDCGRVQDPNSYSSSGSFAEFTPACTDAVSGLIRVTVTPNTADGSWGPTGAYLYYDEESDEHSTQGGRASFNPYDDVAEDALGQTIVGTGPGDGQVGRIDRLYTSGPVPLRAVCTGNSGNYDGFEWLVVPGHSLQYGLTMRTETVTMAIVDAGIVDAETIFDEDAHAPLDMAGAPSRLTS